MEGQCSRRPNLKCTFDIYNKTDVRVRGDKSVPPGQCMDDASQMLFILAWELLRGKSTGEVLQFLERIISRIYEGAITEYDR